MDRQYEVAGFDIQIYPVTDGTHLKLAGRIDERVKLAELASQLHGTVQINLEGVEFINSIGVREWVRLLRELADRHAQVLLVRCSEVMIQQMNVIIQAREGAAVKSFFLPYCCDECGVEQAVCIEVAAIEAQLRALRPPEVACPECSEPMEFDGLPERYFAFLQYDASAASGAQPAAAACDG